MSKQAHFKKNSFTWIISLVVMIILSAGIIVGCIVLDHVQNGKYRNPVEISFTIADTKEIDISSTNAGDYNITEVKEAYDASGKVVAYVVTGTTIGYNQDVPIEISSVISADGTIVCSIDVLRQEETEYLGVRIQNDDFKAQFKGRLLPVVASNSQDTGSPIDMIAHSTISSQAVLDAVNNAQSFVVDNYAPSEQAAE